jgi:hypothetical protein
MNACDPRMSALKKIEGPQWVESRTPRNIVAAQRRPAHRLELSKGFFFERKRPFFSSPPRMRPSTQSAKTISTDLLKQPGRHYE